MRFHRSWPAAVAAAAVVAAACSGGHGSTSTPRRGGTLRLAVAGIGSLDPAQAKTPVQLAVAAAVYQTLTTFDPATLAVRPSLATRWTSTPDQRHWDFFLDPAARFSDGSPVAAADVVATLDRIAVKGSGSPVAGSLAPVSGFDQVNATGAAAHLRGLSAAAADRVHLDLDTPFAELPLALSNPAFGVVSRAPAAGTPAGRPLGSGAFVFASGTPGVVTLSRAPKAKAWLDRIVITGYTSADAAYGAFTHGAADWAVVPPSEVAAAGKRYGTAGYAPLAAELFYGFNLKDPAFASLDVRRAVVHSVDRSALVSRAYAGSARLLSGIIVAGIPGYATDACGPSCSYDPAAARRLVAGIVGGAPTFHIDFDREDPAQAAVASGLRTSLAAAGLTATLRPRALADYQAFALSGKAQLFRLGWVAAYPSADAFLVPLFASGSPTNLTHFSDPAVDKLLLDARSQTDPAKRVADDQRAEQLVLSKLPVIPIAQFTSHAVFGRAVHGLVMNALGGFDPTQVWLAGR